MKVIFALLFIGYSAFCSSQKIALLKYQGGGDWYANPTALPNLILFCNEEINTRISQNVIEIEPDNSDIFNYPFIHMTGHGNVYFSEQDIENIRAYLLAGGFLHIDDNYGMAKFLLSQLKKLFPEKELKLLPNNHSIFQKPFPFPNGLPKIHEHDNAIPQALGFFDDKRLILLFTFETDLGDGWENPEIHNDPEEKRIEALKMGANIIYYTFNNE